MNEQTRIIRLAMPEHPHARRWSWRAASDSDDKPGRFFGQGLLEREDFRALRVGDVVEIQSLGRARVSWLNDGRARSHGQPTANFELLDPAIRRGRDGWLEDEQARLHARMHWVPSPPPPKAERPVRNVRAKLNEACTTGDQIAFFEGDVHPSRGDVVLVNGEIKIRVTGSFPRVPDGSCTFWGVAA